MKLNLNFGHVSRDFRTCIVWSTSH